jgi:hypothetical protein
MVELGLLIGLKKMLRICECRQDRLAVDSGLGVPHRLKA